MSSWYTEVDRLFFVFTVILQHIILVQTVPIIMLNKSNFLFKRILCCFTTEPCLFDQQLIEILRIFVSCELYYYMLVIIGFPGKLQESSTLN